MAGPRNPSIAPQECLSRAEGHILVAAAYLRGRGDRHTLRAIAGYGPRAASQRTWGFVPDGVLRISSQDANPGAGQQEDAHVMANAENGVAERASAVAPEMTGTQPVAPGRTRSGKPSGPAFKPMHHEDMDPKEFETPFSVSRPRLGFEYCCRSVVFLNRVTELLPYIREKMSLQNLLLLSKGSF